MGESSLVSWQRLPVMEGKFQLRSHRPISTPKINIRIILRIEEKGKTYVDLATGGIEVHVDGFGGVLEFEEEELGNDDMNTAAFDAWVHLRKRSFP
ncbi:hypothetical protein COLO4_22765 [Corchorus olitorius]|uniref:Uncharacterized protein n=1 Tax=Corchorus olitorius TaxID=93759 RepID=A0A1R3IK17_9ROSI|nr:hypothetical protein COLO4_22765 [Corchorus olitorius]